MNSPSHFENPINGKILVVDDEPSVLAIAAAILNTIAVTPIKARTGEEAVAAMKAEAAEGRRIALVIQDLTMPGGMSGFETMEALREIDPDIRVIACSGFFQEGALELCRSIGFTSILAKPYTPDSLLGLIRRTLHESPPPRMPKRASAETKPESTSFFVPAAPATSAAPPHPAVLPQDADTDDEYEDDALTQANATQRLPTEPAQKRGPSYLASALVQSVRSRLQPHQGGDEGSSQE
jgi:CheY-like chemotaxis protein